MIHYVIERDEEGMPTRLAWSPAIQAAAEAEEQERALRAQEQATRNALPMPTMREWACRRGLTITDHRSPITTG